MDPDVELSDTTPNNEAKRAGSDESASTKLNPSETTTSLKSKPSDVEAQQASILHDEMPRLPSSLQGDGSDVAVGQSDLSSRV